MSDVYKVCDTPSLIKQLSGSRFNVHDVSGRGSFGRIVDKEAKLRSQD